MNRPSKTLIFVCSPYSGDVHGNSVRARQNCRFVYEQNCVPFAPHLLYPQFLDDANDEERNAGICMGVEMLGLCEELWAFGPITQGMAIEMAAAVAAGKSVRRFGLDCREV